MFKIDKVNIKEYIVEKLPLLFDSSPDLCNKSTVKVHLKEEKNPVTLEVRHTPNALKS